MKLKEIKKMTKKERDKKITECYSELVRLKTMVKAGGSIENPSQIRDIKKNIARILTINNQNISEK